MNKPGNKGNTGNPEISAKVSLADPGILFFLVEMIADKRHINEHTSLHIPRFLSTASVELPVSGNTVLSHGNGFDKINFTTRFMFTCIKEHRGCCVLKWFTSLN